MHNMLKTFLLLGALTGILLFLGRLFGGYDGMVMAFVFSLIMNIGTYFFSDKLALSMSRAKPLEQAQYPELFSIVQELAHAQNIPLPKLYITPDRQANAFATGRDPNHASVAVTAGIMDLLTREELKGVLAHELSHVKNRDILIASIAAVIAGTISYVAQSAMWGRSREENNNSGLFAILAIIVVPIAASLIQMAVSREREFGADDTGARSIGSGRALASALSKIESSARRFPMQTNPALSSLYIGNPLGSLSGGFAWLFSTHPPVAERIERLEKIG